MQQPQVGYLQALEDDGTNVKSNVSPVILFEGENSIGRDDLVSASKQVSRKHVLLKASPDGAFHLSVVSPRSVVYWRRKQTSQTYHPLVLETKRR